jgi:uncharacterized damage-inducible protein DinB
VTSSLLGDAFAHHSWATERLMDDCAGLTAELLTTIAPGTYGSILGTFRHLVATDRWYLSFFPSGEALAPIDEDAELSLAELRSLMASNATAWTELLAGDLHADADVVERGDGWEFHSPLGFRLAQVIHHGTDHRSQICSALTGLGLAPPDIDLWAFGEATGRTRAVRVAAAD